jgi:hypothetical protein
LIKHPAFSLAVKVYVPDPSAFKDEVSDQAAGAQIQITFSDGTNPLFITLIRPLVNKSGFSAINLSL